MYNPLSNNGGFAFYWTIVSAASSHISSVLDGFNLKSFFRFQLSMFGVLPIAIAGLFIDSVHMTVQEVHIYAPFCCTGLTAMRENPLLSEKIAHDPDFRR